MILTCLDGSYQLLLISDGTIFEVCGVLPNALQRNTIYDKLDSCGLIRFNLIGKTLKYGMLNLVIISNTT